MQSPAEVPAAGRRTNGCTVRAGYFDEGICTCETYVVWPALGVTVWTMYRNGMIQASSRRPLSETDGAPVMWDSRGKTRGPASTRRAPHRV
jgi:hypothetical protein